MSTFRETIQSRAEERKRPGSTGGSHRIADGPSALVPVAYIQFTKRDSACYFALPHLNSFAAMLLGELGTDEPFPPTRSRITEHSSGHLVRIANNLSIPSIK